MLKKFFDGLIFGSGFSISILLVLYLALIFLTPFSLHSRVEGPNPISALSQLEEEEGPSFHELPLEKQIEKSSVIALANFEPGEDGKMKAVFTEFLKRDPNVTFYYEIGDEYPSASYYPRENTLHGDGLIVFFIGSPASMRMSMSYSGERIGGLGDLPLKLLREKCSDGGA